MLNGVVALLVQQNPRYGLVVLFSEHDVVKLGLQLIEVFRMSRVALSEQVKASGHYTEHAPAFALL